MFALFAGMQGEAALRARANRIGKVRQQCSTLRAARHRSCARHVDWPWPERVLALDCRRLLELLLRAATGILVAALPIFAVGQKRLLGNCWLLCERSVSDNCSNTCP